MSKSTPAQYREYGRFAAGLFAATVVTTAGLGICVIFVLLVAPDAWWPLVVIASGIGAVGLIFWIFADARVRAAKDSNLYAAQKQMLDEYVESFRPRDRGRRRARFGTNKPPSADDLRKIKEDSNTWSPSERRVDEYRRRLEQGEERGASRESRE